MPTTVHIPGDLLERADARAKLLGISRNRLIVEALEARLATEDGWPEDLVQTLAEPMGPETKAVADDMDAVIRAGRRSRKSRPEL
jgi:hypothetical protein